MSNSEWALNKWEEAVEQGDQAAANDYQEMYQLWKGREGKPCSE